MASCTWRNGHRERREEKVNARFLITLGEKKKEGKGQGKQKCKNAYKQTERHRGNTPDGLQKFINVSQFDDPIDEKTVFVTHVSVEF